MATDLRNLPYNIAGDTEFRAWIQGVEAALVACGLVVTADTGQLDPTTAVKPATATFAGGRMYRFNDALQATKPIFIKVSYGVSGGSFNIPMLAVQVGTATTGANVIAGIAAPSRTLQVTTVPAAAETRNTYVSGDMAGNARIALIGGIDTALGSTAFNRVSGFSVERSKDAAGADTGEAVHVQWWFTSTGSHQSFSFTGLTPGIEATMPSVSPTQSMAAGTDVGLAPIFPIFGKILPPLLSLMGYWNGDLQGLVGVPVNIYGVDHNYLPMGPNSNGAWLRGGGSGVSAALAAFLWE